MLLETRTGRGVALDLANGVGDGSLAQGERLSRWLTAVGGPNDADPDALQRLGRTVRASLDAVADRRVPADADAEVLNRLAASAPPVPQLEAGELAYVARASPSEAFLAEIAADAIELAGGPGRARLRRCAAAGCDVLFVASRERQTWCGARCGARARVARSRAARRRDG